MPEWHGQPAPATFIKLQSCNSHTRLCLAIMSVSYTLSDIAADFGAGAKHVANSASPFLTFEFGTPPKIFKSTMVKHGGAVVMWQQPVLLTGASTSRLMVSPGSGTCTCGVQPVGATRHRLPDVQISAEQHVRCQRWLGRVFSPHGEGWAVACS